MVKRRKVVITNNKEIYDKFIMLNFSPEIVLKDVKKLQVNRIIKNLNRHNKILDVEYVGDYIVVRKLAPVNFSIYLR